MVGPPAQPEPPPPRRAPAEPAEPPVLHRVPPTPAAVFAPPGVPERRIDREPMEIAPLPPEAPVPLAQPPRTAPMAPEAPRPERHPAALRASTTAETETFDRRQSLRVVPEQLQRLDVEASVRTVAAAAVRQLAAEEPAERVGLWQARNGPRYEFFGPPRDPAEASPGEDADLDRWAEDRDTPVSDRASGGTANGIHGPTPEQISSLEQEMARLLGEIAGKRTS
jgi:hypothetical protein